MQPLAGILVLSLFFCLMHSCIGDNDRDVVVVFKGDQTEVPYTQDNGSIIMRKPRAFRVPAFVGEILNNKEFLAVFCDARYQGFADWSFIEPAVKTSYGNYSSWSDADIFAKNTRKNLNLSVVGDITAVMKGNKIFVLAPSWDVKIGSWVQQQGNVGWDPFMIVGSVVTSADSKSGAFIHWENNRSLKSILPRTINGGNGFQFIGGVGNGIVMKNGTIVFPIQMANDRNEVSSSSMYSIDNGTTWIMGGPTENGPSECSVVEWGEGKLLLNTRFNGGVRNVYESNDMGKTWKESLMFSKVWGNQPNRQDVGSQGSAITLPVDGKDVLLFSHPLNSKGRYARDTLLLWLSDGQRILRVGTISEKGKGESSGYSILALVGNNLYVLHEINPFGDWNNYDAALKEWDRVLAISPLPHFYKKINDTVRAWRELDAGLKNKGVPVNGLVGFLGNPKGDAVWEDMYSCVNAIVKGGERDDGGFRFTSAPGSGAQWPVSSQGQNQVYIFTKKQFTLAATVTIHATSGAEDVSLLGASAYAYGSRVLLGLGYTQDKKWQTLYFYNKKNLTNGLVELGREYHVAITFENGAASVYVDGTDTTEGKIRLSSTVAISHFFMGGMGRFTRVTGAACTVKNVMLFNRALDQEEIFGLKNVDKENQQNKQTLTTESTNIPVGEETLPVTESTNIPVGEETLPVTESTNIPVGEETLPVIDSTNIPVGEETVQVTKTTIIAVNQETVVTKKPIKISKNCGLVSTVEFKEVSATVRQKVTNGNRIHKKINKSTHEYRDTAFEKHVKGDNCAVISFSNIAWTCLVFSFIVLLGFLNSVCCITCT